MAHLRYEAWPTPGTAPYEVRVRDLQPVAGSGNLPLKGVGSGSVEIPATCLLVDGSRLIDAVAYTDPANPANDVASLIRVYRPGTATPIHEWLIEDPVPDTDGVIRLSGRNIEAVLDWEHVEVFDWDGTDDFQTRFPDWIYGGRNLADNGDLETPQTIPETYTLWNDQTPAGTFTLTVEGFTTGAIAYNATAFAVETALEATAGVTNVYVTGTGTQADPWRIEFADPAILAAVMTVADTGLVSTLDREQTGRFTVDPFTQSETLEYGINIIHGRHSAGHPFISVAQAHAGTYSLAFAPVELFTGVQQVISVKPGGTYQASMWAYTADAAAPFRLVIRTPSEELLATTTFTGTTLTASTWTQFTISDVQIPEGVTEIVMRFAYLKDTQSTNVYTDDWAFTEGQAPATIGTILTELLDDAQTDHAPTRAALTFLNPTFTTTLDSNGAAWDSSTVSLTVQRRQTYLQVMHQIEALGYEWDLTPAAAGVWDFNVYNPGTLGTDYTGLDDPAIVTGQGTIASAVTRQTPAGNYVMVEGQDGMTSRVTNAASVGAIGRRTVPLFDRRLTDTSPLATWAAAKLSDYLAETLAPRLTVQEPNVADAWPRPLDEYGPGDTVDFTLRDVKVPRVVEAVTYADSPQDGLRWTISGGSASGYVPAPTGTQSGFTGTVAAELRVLGDTVLGILQAVRTEPNLEASTSGGRGRGLPAFTVRVAAPDSRLESQQVADFLGEGEETIQLSAAESICTSLGFGRVLLSEGEFTIDRSHTVPAGVSVEGLGPGVTILRVVTGGTLTVAGDLSRVSVVEDVC